MSHFVNYAIAFTNTQHIEQALEEMGYQIERNTQINGYGRQTHDVEIAGIKSNQHQIGFVRVKGEAGAADSFEAVADWMYVRDADKVRNRMAQLNSKYQVIDALKKARFRHTVREENGELVIMGTR